MPRSSISHDAVKGRRGLPDGPVGGHHDAVLVLDGEDGGAGLFVVVCVYGVRIADSKRIALANIQVLGRRREEEGGRASGGW